MGPFFHNQQGEKIFESIKKPILDQNGKTIGIVGIARDITARYEYEDRLKKYERIVDTSMDQMALVNREYEYEAANNSYLKAHASKIIRELSNNQQTLIITQNGEAKAIVQDIKAYEELQESLALLKVLAQSNANIQKGEIKPLKEAFKDIKACIEQGK